MVASAQPGCAHRRRSLVVVLRPRHASSLALLPALLLALGTWLLYVADRILDGLRQRSGRAARAPSLSRPPSHAFLCGSFAAGRALGLVCPHPHAPRSPPRRCLDRGLCPSLSLCGSPQDNRTHPAPGCLRSSPWPFSSPLPPPCPPGLASGRTAPGWRKSNWRPPSSSLPCFAGSIA